MTEDEARKAAEEDAAYLWGLLRKGINIENALRMVIGRIVARHMAEAAKPPKEPWQQ